MATSVAGVVSRLSTAFSRSTGGSQRARILVTKKANQSRESAATWIDGNICRVYGRSGTPIFHSCLCDHVHSHSHLFVKKPRLPFRLCVCFPTTSNRIRSRSPRLPPGRTINYLIHYHLSVTRSDDSRIAQNTREQALESKGPRAQ
jgi:hypothetical protein